MGKNDKIVRYRAHERLNHWAVVLCFIFSALSGLGFFFPSFNWLLNIYGTPQLARILHPFIGGVMFAGFLAMFFRYWKHNIFERSDWEWLRNINKIIHNQEMGDVGKYNLGQKCVFWSAVITLVLLAVSGIIMWQPYFAPLFPHAITRLAIIVHSVSAVALILVIIVHVYAALWVKGSITAMVEGWVTSAWAKKHHPRWIRELKDKR